LNELTESLFTSLRDAIDGRDVSSMSIDDEEIASLEAILYRLTLLAKSRDITEVMEDEEGGQSSGWEIVCAFAERGELPYKDEAKVSWPPRGLEQQLTNR
jgi:cohesin complex subunit SA-1/2